jgi:hypothetical protein
MGQYVPASFRGHSASFTQIREGIASYGRRALLPGGLPFHKAVHPFFELISIDTQVFTNPVSSRFVGNPSLTGCVRVARHSGRNRRLRRRSAGRGLGSGVGLTMCATYRVSGIYET